MPTWFARSKTHAHRLWGFIRRVIADFSANRGLLLAGGLAYNGLLSAIPLVSVLVMALSLFVDQTMLIATISAELRLLIPSHAGTLTAAVHTLLDNRGVIGGVGIAVLLFFSSIAFRMLEEAIATIFHAPPDHVDGRSFWMSALIPYLYMVVIGIGIVGVTTMTALLETFSDASFMILGWQLSLANLPGVLTYVSGFIGMVALFTSAYKLLPVVQINLNRAVIGGVTASILWEIVRRISVWYFANISLVNVIYGSLATVIVVLLGLEIGAVILLLGAQIIAELEQAADDGRPWYVPADESTQSPSAGIPADGLHGE